MSNDNNDNKKDLGPELMDFLNGTPYSEKNSDNINNINPDYVNFLAGRRALNALRKLEEVDPNASIIHDGISYDKQKLYGAKTSNKTYKGKKTAR